MKTIEEQIGKTLADEDGGGFVCIWRKDNSIDLSHYGTVGEFLTKKENQSGVWLIDGGWGGPPGPIHVKWDENKQEWINGGFCGHSFAK